MANPEHVEIVKRGAKAIDEWRIRNHPTRLELKGAGLSGASLRDANLTEADLRGANFSGADLQRATLREANLLQADLSQAIFRRAILAGATLSRANLSEADLSRANLRNANLSRADLRDANLTDASLSLTNSPIQYYSCFISYSTKDQEFAERLHNDLQAKGVRCWFAPEDMQGGKLVDEQLSRAIQLNDRLLLILSPHSMSSGWVEIEIANARKREVSEKRQILFPVRICDYDTLRSWKCIDPDLGTDNAREIRKYHIPDFSHWDTNATEYAKEFEKLLRDLKADEPKKGEHG